MTAPSDLEDKPPVQFQAGTLDAMARVLDFWIHEVGHEGWFANDPALDRACERRLGALAGLALEGRLSDWLARPAGALALVILLDQMPRNVHRGTAQAFAADPQAFAVAVTALSRGYDLAMPEPARLLFYLPLSHHETMAAQNRAVRLAASRLPRENADGNGETLAHAIKHREVIRRFGRFPSRNAVLGRADTAAERAYREGGGYMG
ncbi:MAG: DUF924 family protein [Pseudomonadota bacterium]